MSDRKFAYLVFENANRKATETIICKLEESPALECEFATGDVGELLVSYSSKIEYSLFKEIAEKIVWEFNGGMHCDSTERSYEEIKHLL